jgi:hypothetical protein
MESDRSESDASFIVVGRETLNKSFSGLASVRSDSWGRGRGRKR